MLPVPKSGVPDADMCIIFEIKMVASPVFDMAIRLIISLLIQILNYISAKPPLT